MLKHSGIAALPPDSMGRKLLTKLESPLSGISTAISQINFTDEEHFLYDYLVELCNMLWVDFATVERYLRIQGGMKDSPILREVTSFKGDLSTAKLMLLQ